MQRDLLHRPFLELVNIPRRPTRIHFRVHARQIAFPILVGLYHPRSATMARHIKFVLHEFAGVGACFPPRTRTRLRRKIQVCGHLHRDVRHELSSSGLSPVWVVGSVWGEKDISDSENLACQLLQLLIAVIQASLFGEPAFPGRNERTTVIHQRQKVIGSIVIWTHTASYIGSEKHRLCKSILEHLGALRRRKREPEEPRHLISRIHAEHLNPPRCLRMQWRETVYRKVL